MVFSEEEDGLVESFLRPLFGGPRLRRKCARRLKAGTHGILQIPYFARIQPVFPLNFPIHNVSLDVTGFRKSSYENVVADFFGTGPGLRNSRR